MKYRREIDGLRAFAVLPVIFFHAGFVTFGGGYIGVDVFFVISGYLITSLILAELQAGRFSLIHFYERRARRILPALFLVMLTSIPFAWLWLLPSDMKSFSQSLVAVSAFSSNILFWRQTGYFDVATELKPLLHTWSLAVEEQYYLLFPILLLLLWRFGTKRIVGLLIVVAIASLAMAQWGSAHQPTATFYLLPSRGWELLIGVFIAFYLSAREHDATEGRSTVVVNQSASLAGLVLLIYSLYAFGRDTPYPSFYALIPTLGAAMIILFANPQTLVGQVLGSRLFVGVGLISYSAYLWHYPIFAFARHRSLGELRLPLILLLLCSTVGLAYLSWRFVERPFRERGRVAKQRILGLSVIFTAGIALFGFLGHTNGGFAARKSVNGVLLRELDVRLRANYGLDEVCDGVFTLSPKCRTSDAPELLLWGDSHAMHLMQGILAADQHIKVIQMTKSDCGPIVGLAQLRPRGVNLDWPRGCIEFNDAVLNWVRSNRSVKFAVLGSAFSRYTSQNARFLASDGSTATGTDFAFVHLLSTLDLLVENGIRPVIFAPTPQTGVDIGRCLAKATRFGLAVDACNFDLADANGRQVEVTEFLERVGKRHKVIWLKDGICDGTTCAASVGGTFLYRDAEHLSHEGSALLGRKMKFNDLFASKRSVAGR